MRNRSRKRRLAQRILAEKGKDPRLTTPEALSHLQVYELTKAFSNAGVSPYAFPYAKPFRVVREVNTVCHFPIPFSWDSTAGTPPSPTKSKPVARSEWSVSTQTSVHGRTVGRSLHESSVPESLDEFSQEFAQLLVEALSIADAASSDTVRVSSTLRFVF